jgi:hypothetical protein
VPTVFTINDNIHICQLANISEKKFINEQMDQSANSTFHCCKCSTKNSFSITPYETEFSFLELYKNKNLLSEEEIVENKIAEKTSKWVSYLGEYTVNDLPILYFGTACSNCSETHLLVFGCGEKQPGLTICETSGIWSIKLSLS